MTFRALTLLLVAGALTVPAAGIADTPVERAIATIDPGFSQPGVQAVRRGLVVMVRNTSPSVLNVRVAATERAGGRRHAYRPVLTRIARGEIGAVRLTAPETLAPILRGGETPRAFRVTVLNAESNAGREVRQRAR